MNSYYFTSAQVAQIERLLSEIRTETKRGRKNRISNLSSRAALIITKAKRKQENTLELP